MIYYIIRRVLYAFPILLGVNLITFVLFFIVNSPDDMARAHLGQKYIQQEAIQQWKIQHGYDQPLFYNSEAHGLKTWTQTLFFQKSLKLFSFNFGFSDSGRNISYDISERMWPSLAIALPTLVISLFINIVFSLWIVLFRYSLIDKTALLICVILISISGLFYIIAGQFIFSRILQWFPISGFAYGWISIKFLVLPILVSVISGLGPGIRWYRSLFLEEIHKDYVRTARAKGLTECLVMSRHVLPNAFIPIATGIVALIPSLFLGSLILESFFGVPGLGSYVIDAIQTQDFAIVRSMVFLGTILYILGLIMTDIVYSFIDPRVRLH